MAERSAERNAQEYMLGRGPMMFFESGMFEAHEQVAGDQKPPNALTHFEVNGWVNDRNTLRGQPLANSGLSLGSGSMSARRAKSCKVWRYGEYSLRKRSHGSIRCRNNI